MVCMSRRLLFWETACFESGKDAKHQSQQKDEKQKSCNMSKERSKASARLVVSHGKTGHKVSICGRSQKASGCPNSMAQPAN